MMHPIYRVQLFEIIAPYTLRVQFDDGTRQTINFEPVLAGELYGCAGYFAHPPSCRRFSTRNSPD
jgi:hypothetical protein